MLLDITLEEYWALDQILSGLIVETLQSMRDNPATIEREEIEKRLTLYIQFQAKITKANAMRLLQVETPQPSTPLDAPRSSAEDRRPN